MATPRKIGGPAHRREINRAKRANHYARMAMDQILAEQLLAGHPGRTRMLQLLTDIAHQLGIELESLMEMEAIIIGGEGAETDEAEKRGDGLGENHSQAKGT